MKSLILSLILISSYANASWKLPELARASNALLVEMDAVGANKKSNCGLTSIQVSQASQKLQSLIDNRVTNLKSQVGQIKSLMKSCDSDCSCDIYQYALEKLSPSETKANQTSTITSAQRKACFQKLTNFCSSKLFQQLLKK